MIVAAILIYTTTKGFRLGFTISIFNIVRILLSVALTKRYYPSIYGYIINNPNVYNIFEVIVQFVLNILFHTKNKENPSFIPNLISKGLIKIIISLFAIALIFWITNKLIKIFLGLFSFVLKTPVLKQLNKFGGILFGLIEGLFIIYLLNLVLSPIASIFPNSFIGKGVFNSLVFDYLKEMNLMFNIFTNKTYI